LLLTDTVGFIQKLSPMVVAAFRATLEELAESDILLHVVDITHPKAREQTEVVEKTLQDLGLGNCPRLLVANKIDLLPPGQGNNKSEYHGGSKAPGGVRVSAAKGWNLDILLQKVESRLMVIDGPLTVVGAAASD
jgi:GTP-binding protein HflX